MEDLSKRNLETDPDPDIFSLYASSPIKCAKNDYSPNFFGHQNSNYSDRRLNDDFSLDSFPSKAYHGGLGLTPSVTSPPSTPLPLPFLSIQQQLHHQQQQPNTSSSLLHSLPPISTSYFPQPRHFRSFSDASDNSDCASPSDPNYRDTIAMPEFSRRRPSDASNTSTSSHAMFPSTPSHISSIPSPIPSLTSPLGNPERTLLFRGPILQVISHNLSKDRHMFLWDDLLVITKFSESSESHQVKHLIPLETMTIHTYPRPCIYDSPDHPAILSCLRRFALNPVVAISKLIQKGLLPSNSSAIAHFLHAAPLHPKALGQFLSELDHRDILRSYLEMYPLHGLRLDVGLRLFLGGLRLPSEAQVIDEMIDEFIKVWWEINKSFPVTDSRIGVTNFEEARKVAFGILGLNADLWNRFNGNGSIVSELDFIQGFQSVTNVLSNSFLQNWSSKSSQGVQGMSERLLGDVYKAIQAEKLEMAELPSKEQTPVIISCSETLFSVTPCSSKSVQEGQPKDHLQKSKDSKDSFPKALYISHSTTLVFTIPEKDPNLVIRLWGTDVTFVPDVFTFHNSSTVSIQVSPGTVGRKHIYIRKFGSARGNYFIKGGGDRSVTVEKPYMRYSWGIECLELENLGESTPNATFKSTTTTTKIGGGKKRKYVFAVDDGITQEAWRDLINEAQSSLKIFPKHSDPLNYWEKESARLTKEGLTRDGSALDSRKLMLRLSNENDF